MSIPSVDGSLVYERYLRVQAQRPRGLVNDTDSVNYGAAYLTLPPDASIVYMRMVGGGGAGGLGGTIADGSNWYRNGNGGGGGGHTYVIMPVALTGRRLLLVAGFGGNAVANLYGQNGEWSYVQAWHEAANRWFTIAIAGGGGGGLDPDAGGGGAAGGAPDPVYDPSRFGVAMELPGQAGQTSTYGSPGAHLWSYLPGKGGTAAGGFNLTSGLYRTNAGYNGSGVFPDRLNSAAGSGGRTGETGPGQANIPQIPYPGCGGIDGAGGSAPALGNGGPGCGGGGGETNGAVGGPGVVEVWWR